MQYHWLTVSESFSNVFTVMCVCFLKENFIFIYMQRLREDTWSKPKSFFHSFFCIVYKRQILAKRIEEKFKCTKKSEKFNFLTLKRRRMRTHKKMVNNRPSNDFCLAGGYLVLFAMFTKYTLLLISYLVY